MIDCKKVEINEDNKLACKCMSLKNAIENCFGKTKMAAIL